MATYQLQQDKNRALTKNFRVREFACKDGSDTVVIDDALPVLLQKLRDELGCSIVINSAYRTAAYNKKVGGASRSQHLYGKAADIRANGRSPGEVCAAAERLGFKGIGRYDTFSHVDVRKTKSFWDSSKGRQEEKVQTFQKSACPYPQPTTNVKRGSVGDGVRWVQWMLNQKGYACGTVDGVCGAKTVDAIRRFQKANGISADGVCGKNTRACLVG